jgi:hypothetical protein
VSARRGVNEPVPTEPIRSGARLLVRRNVSDSEGVYRTPYTPTPGSSTPSPHVGPSEGRAELYGFVLLSLINTAIILVVGMAAYFVVH